MKSNNKLIKLLVGLMLIIFSLSIQAEMDRIAVIINNDVILKSEVKQRKEEMNTDSITTTKMAAESLALEYIQTQKAKQLGIQINDASLDKVIAKLAANNNLSITEFAAQLKQQYQIDFVLYREGIRRKMMITQLRKTHIFDYSEIAANNVDELIKNESIQLYKGSDFKFEHLLIKTPKKISIDQFRELQKIAENKRNDLLKGQSFSQVMNKPSTVVSLKEVGAAQKAILKELSILEKGELSRVFHNNGGFHVVRLLQNLATEGSIQKEYLVRHILLTDSDAEEKIKQLRQRLDEGEVFSALASTYSSDDSARQGGKIGWSVSSKYVPSFARVVKSSAISEVSQPFKTRYGWHILEVLDYRQTDIVQNKLRHDAMKLLRSKKAKNAYMVWLEEQLSLAHVEYRLD